MSYSRPDQCEGFVFDLSQVRLDDAVPLPVRKLFEAARGALVFSVMFYPLLTLGAEQLLRVLETSLVFKCQQMNAPDIGKFSQRVEWLRKHKAISTDDEVRWKQLVELRNEASHPKDQMIFGLAQALTILDATVELVDLLFAQAVK
jgi:hypothetical protein